MRIITCAEAIREALREEMLRDGAVFLMGEDIGRYGGTFQATAGLFDEFGGGRVIDTPISETAFTGAGVGAAATGMRPVIEIMFSDFTAVCFDQIINQAAKLRYMSGGSIKIPMVIRAASGGGTGAAAQHSQSLESMFCHIPGLKVAAPSTPRDAKGLLKSAIRDDNCVIFLEQKLLYDETGEVPDGEYTIPLGKAEIRREGTDVSLITYGRTSGMCMRAAQNLKNEGISAEVLDLRTLSPLDTEAILESVGKTGRAVVVHEAVEFAGFGGEIAATIAGSGVFRSLKAPVRRVGALFSPVPFSRALEAAVLPDEVRIEAAVREVMRG